MKVALFFECTEVGIQLQCKGYVRGITNIFEKHLSLQPLYFTTTFCIFFSDSTASTLFHDPQWPDPSPGSGSSCSRALGRRGLSSQRGLRHSGAIRSCGSCGPGPDHHGHPGDWGRRRHSRWPRGRTGRRGCCGSFGSWRISRRRDVHHPFLQAWWRQRLLSGKTQGSQLFNS